MVQTDAMFEPAANLRAVRTGELEAFESVAESRFFLPCADIQAGEVLRALGSLQLREVDDVNWTLPFAHEPLESLCQGDLRISIIEGNGPVLRKNGDRGPGIQLRKFLLKKRGIAQRRRHQQEPRLWQC